MRRIDRRHRRQVRRCRHPLWRQRIFGGTGTASYAGQISGQPMVFNNIPGTFITTAGGYGLWMPYTTWTTVQTQILFT